MVTMLELPKYLDDKESDFNDFDSVGSNEIKYYEDRYKAMMRGSMKKKDKIYWKLPKKHL